MHEGLNPEQRRAVETIQGPVLVLAGAGSGKTRVITHRIGHLLATGVQPERILAVTFTNKAASEMKERLRTLVSPERAVAVKVSTFHSFGLWLVRRFARQLGLSPSSQVIDEGDRNALIGQVRQELNMAETDLTSDEWRGFLMQVKGCGRPAEEVAQELGYVKRSLVLSLLDHYNRRLALGHQLDFDDLVLLGVRLLDAQPDIRRSCQELFDYILVDEYQDTNFLQFRLLQCLVDARCNLCVVGDDDQSIYGWRGARVENILEFDRHFPGASVIKLTRNYRSEKSILDLANAIISRNQHRREKELWTSQASSIPVRTVAFEMDRDEAFGLVSEIRSFRSEGVPEEQMAVLYRTKGQSKVFQEIFRLEGIPYRVVGSFDFFERKEVRDFLAYLRIVTNPRDDMAFLRVANYPLRGLGTTTLQRIRQERGESGCLLGSARELLTHSGTGWNQKVRRGLGEFVALVDDLHEALKRATPGDMTRLVRQMLHRSGMWDDLTARGPGSVAAVQSLLALMEQGLTRGTFQSVQDFLERVTLQQNEADFSSGEETSGKVTLMTVHSAKGLEFQVVFVVGLVDGLFPHARSVEESGIEEERRLFYVALTRARRHLTLSWFRHREERGEMCRWQPSRFLGEIPEGLVEDQTLKRNRPLTREEAIARFEAFDKRLKG